MQTSQLALADNFRADQLALEEIGRSIALAHVAVTEEPLSDEMALLLLRVALAEVVSGVADGECPDAEAEPSILWFRDYLQSAFAATTLQGA
jgi:hypothetical protein